MKSLIGLIEHIFTYNIINKIFKIFIISLNIKKSKTILFSIISKCFTSKNNLVNLNILLIKIQIKQLYNYIL